MLSMKLMGYFSLHVWFQSNVIRYPIGCISLLPQKTFIVIYVWPVWLCSSIMETSHVSNTAASEHLCKCMRSADPSQKCPNMTEMHAWQSDLNAPFFVWHRSLWARSSPSSDVPNRVSSAILATPVPHSSSSMQRNMTGKCQSSNCSQSALSLPLITYFYSPPKAATAAAGIGQSRQTYATSSSSMQRTSLRISSASSALSQLNLCAGVAEKFYADRNGGRL